MDTYKKLYEAVKAHSELDDDQLREIAEHGADAGWSGFTYTGDCVDFYEANEAEIYELLNEQAESMGYDSPEAMIATFNRKDMLQDPDQRKNLLAWFALEEVAHWVESGGQND